MLIFATGAKILKAEAAAQKARELDRSRKTPSPAVSSPPPTLTSQTAGQQQHVAQPIKRLVDLGNKTNNVRGGEVLGLTGGVIQDHAGWSGLA